VSQRKTIPDQAAEAASRVRAAMIIPMTMKALAAVTIIQVMTETPATEMAMRMITRVATTMTIAATVILAAMIAATTVQAAMITRAAMIAAATIQATTAAVAATTTIRGIRGYLGSSGK
jgi:hypothetical protein